MWYFPVNIIFIDALGKQLADDKIDFPVVGIIGKATRISHHTGINTLCSCFGNFIEITHTAYQTEHQFGSGRYIRM